VAAKTGMSATIDGYTQFDFSGGEIEHAVFRKGAGPGVLVMHDSSQGNVAGIRPHVHSVLTEDYSDAPGQPTRAAFDDVIAFLRRNLSRNFSGSTTS
jgi:hypothetical protein